MAKAFPDLGRANIGRSVVRTEIASDLLQHPNRSIEHGLSTAVVTSHSCNQAESITETPDIFSHARGFRERQRLAEQSFVAAGHRSRISSYDLAKDAAANNLYDCEPFPVSTLDYIRYQLASTAGLCARADGLQFDLDPPEILAISRCK